MVAPFCGTQPRLSQCPSGTTSEEVFCECGVCVGGGGGGRIVSLNANEAVPMAEV